MYALLKLAEKSLSEINSIKANSNKGDPPSPIFLTLHSNVRFISQRHDDLARIRLLAVIIAIILARDSGYRAGNCVSHLHTCPACRYNLIRADKGKTLLALRHFTVRRCVVRRFYHVYYEDRDHGCLVFWVACDDNGMRSCRGHDRLYDRASMPSMASRVDRRCTMMLMITS